MVVLEIAVKTWSIRTGWHRHEKVMLPDGRVATEWYTRWTGPEKVGEGRWVTKDPLPPEGEPTCSFWERK